MMMRGKPKIVALYTALSLGKGDLWILGAIVTALLLSVACVIAMPVFMASVADTQGQGLMLEIQRPGFELFVSPVDVLLTEGDTRWALEGPAGGLLLVYAQAQGFHVQSAACPDRVCVHTGYISRGGQSIVCVPNETVIRLRYADYADYADDGKGDVLDGILR